MVSTCPVCNVASGVLLQPGQPCMQCKSQQAWSELGGKGLVIDKAAIELALQRRAGEAAGEPLWKRALVLAPLALALAVAVPAGWYLYQLMAPQEVGPLTRLIDHLVTSMHRATGFGLLALVVGIAGAIRLRRRRQFRQVAFVAGHAVPIIVGAAAFALGVFHWWSFRGLSAEYVSMPARPQLDITASEERILNATVVVVAPDGDGDARMPALGTGAVVAADDHRAWIVTCSHVAMPYAAVGSIRHAARAHPVWVQLADGREGKARVRWAAPPPLDVVLIELPIEHPPEPVTIAPDASAMEPKASVTFVPLPYRSGWKVVHGELLHRETHRTPAGTYDLLYTSLPVTFGDSGSGLFDARGQLVGINTWTRLGPEASQGISLPSETMRALVAAIERGALDQLDDSLPALPGK